MIGKSKAVTDKLHMIKMEMGAILSGRWVNTGNFKSSRIRYKELEQTRKNIYDGLRQAYVKG